MNGSDDDYARYYKPSDDDYNALKVGQVDGKQPIQQMSALNGALYVLADEGFNLVERFPAFVLKFTLPK